MKRIYLSIGLLFIQATLCSSGGTTLQPWEQENFDLFMFNEEIRYSVEENNRQKKLNNEQTQNTAVETVNQSQWKKYKETAQKIQDRLRVVDFTLQAIPTGFLITQKTKNIRQTQSKIIQEISSAPKALKDVLPQQIKFTEDLQMVLRFITGIVVSYGAINQMEKAERKILLDYAFDEVERLERDSSSILMVIRTAKEREQRRRSLLDYYINRDKELVEDIVRNMKKL